MILITGASGFVGVHLVEALGNRVPTVPLRLFDVRPYPGILPAHALEHRGSIEDPREVACAMRGVAVVMHLAAHVEPGSTDLARSRRINVGGTAALIEAATAVGSRLFVHVSSAGIYGLPRPTTALRETDGARPLSPYQLTKWEAEQRLLRADAGETTINILRPTGIYGAGSRLELPRYRRLMRRHWSLGVRGQVRLNPVHVSDLVGAMLAVLEAPAPHRSIFNVGGERPMRADELDHLVVETLGVPHRRYVIPPLLARPLAAMAVPLLAAVGRPNPLLPCYARGEDLSQVVDDGAFRTRYPGVPVRNMRDGLRDHIAWARDQHLLATGPER